MPPRRKYRGRPARTRLRRMPLVRPMPLKKVPDELDEAIEQCEVEIASMRQGGVRKVALADGLVKLAKLYGRKKMLAEMEPILMEALKIRETELGREHLSVSV